MESGKQMRFTDGEIKIIRDTFKENDELLKIMRKVFLPEFDPRAPFGQTVDLWMTVPIRDKPTEEALRNILVRNEVIMHVETMLMQLSILANQKEETSQQTQERLKKDSTK